MIPFVLGRCITANNHWAAGGRIARAKVQTTTPTAYHPPKKSGLRFLLRRISTSRLGKNGGLRPRVVMAITSAVLLLVEIDGPKDESNNQASRNDSPDLPRRQARRGSGDRVWVDERRRGCRGDHSRDAGR